MICFFSISEGQQINYLKLLNDSATSPTFLLAHDYHNIKINSIEEAKQIKKIEFAFKNSADQNIVDAAFTTGIFYLKNNIPSKAISFFQTAEKYSLKINDKHFQADIRFFIGFACQNQKKYADAITTYASALNLCNPSERINFAIIYSMIAECNFYQKKIASSIELYKRASKLYYISGEILNAAICFNDAGEIELRNEDYKSASESFYQALSVIKSADINSKKLKAICYRNLGLIAFKQADFESALKFFNNSLQNDKKLIVKKLIKDSYLQLFTLYGFKNEFDKADSYHNKYRSIKDSIDAVERSLIKNKILPLSADEEEKFKIIDLLHKKHDDDFTSDQHPELSRIITKTDLELQNKDQQLFQKDSVVDVLTTKNLKRERDLAKVELQISRQKNLKNILIAVSIIILLATLFLLNRYLFKRNSNRKLESANKELQETLTQLKQTQVRLIHSEKMASLGKLTAGIAHEIQNPLNFVNNFSQSAIELAAEIKSESDQAEKTIITDELIITLEKIAEHGSRADKIVRNMLLHSHSGSNVKQETNINKLCDEMLELAYNSGKNSYPGFECSFEKNFYDVPAISVQQQEISRVLLNIYSNSFYAMNKKLLAVKNYVPSIGVTTGIENGSIFIIVKDNGTGIPKHDLDRVFEPFFTTKPPGEGTGMGLSLSFDIITKGHGGTMDVESELNTFTEFRITLPVNS